LKRRKEITDIMTLENYKYPLKIKLKIMEKKELIRMNYKN